MKKWITLVFLVGLSNVYGQTGTNEIAKTIDVKDFKERMEVANQFIILDVRTPDEWAEGIIKDAVKINFFGDSFEAELDNLDRSKTIFVYCKSGGRSGKAMKKMVEKGFKEIYNLDGGITAWRKANYEISQ